MRNHEGVKVPEKFSGEKKQEKGRASNEISDINFRNYEKYYETIRIPEVIKKLGSYKKLEEYYLQKFDDSIFDDLKPAELRKRITRYRESMLIGIWSAVIEPKLTERILEQEETIKNWYGFIRKQITGILEDYFPEELWAIRDFLSKSYDKRNIKRIKRIRREIKELTYIGEYRDLTEKELWRLEYLKVAIKRVEDFSIGPGTAELPSDDDDYEHPLLRSAEDYIDAIEFRKRKKRKG